MFIGFSKRLKSMGGVRFGVGTRLGKSAFIILPFIGIMYLMWYMIIFAGWGLYYMIYAMYKIYYLLFKGIFIGIKKLYYFVTKKIEPPKIENLSTKKREFQIEKEIDGHLVKYVYDDVKIAVIRGDEPSFENLRGGLFIDLVREPNNPYDSNAIIVNCNNLQLGYLYKGKIQDIANDFIRKNLPIRGFITKCDSENKLIELNLLFYK